MGAVSRLPRPAAGWRHRATSVARRVFGLPIAGLAIMPIALAALAARLALDDPHARALALVAAVCAVAALTALAVLARAIRQELFVPLSETRQWAMRVRAGDLAARMPQPQTGEFGELARDVNVLADTLGSLSRDLEARVERATQRIAQKTRSLEILYQVAATINASRDLNDLLAQFLEILHDVVDARAGAVRLLTSDGKLRLVASLGLDEDFTHRERLVPVTRCACGRVATEGSLVCRDVARCQETLERPVFMDHEGDCGRSLDMIAVPLSYRGRVLGVYNLFVERPIPFAAEDLNDLLTSIGRHLGVAIEKARLDDEATRLSVMEERTLLAHELHDSLAQTLASLRFQVRILDDRVRGGGRHEVVANVERVAASLDEAHTELRELLAQFRAPMDKSGLVAAIEKAIGVFARDTGIDIFFQQEWYHTRMPVGFEMQVLRIVQECLANVRKHSEAHHVRIILHHDQEQEACWMLIEDDGVGFSQTALTGRPGEHVGLSIMEDRARRVGGSLKIESEPGEGTRVMLTFRVPDRDPVREQLATRSYHAHSDY